MVRVLNRARLQELECRLEGNLARIQLKARGVKDVEVGYGRLRFRQGGKRWTAGFEHLSADRLKPFDPSFPSIEVPYAPPEG